MADSDDKTKLYKTIAGADQWLVLARMQQTGFWPSGAGLPAEPAAERDERLALEARSAALASSHLAVVDLDKALETERLRRTKESRAKRAARQNERADAAAVRRAAHQAKLKADVVHLGEGVSARLEQRESNVERLTANRLPLLNTTHDVAKALGCSLGQLRFLTYHREGAALVHYHRFSIPKKTGGVRAISAPKPKLAAAQRWVLVNVLEQVGVDAHAHGFVKQRNVLSNATPHLKQKVVLNLDLKDFFPTLTFARVRGLFAALGYSGQVATVFALLCTEPPRVAMTLDETTTFVALSSRVLPQGACTSPALTNLASRRLDKRLTRLCEVNGFVYTRYADDLTFSGQASAHVGRLLRSTRSILASEGFVVNEQKTQVMRSGRRQEVTGVVVNDKPGIGRDELRTLRAVLHNAAKHGLASQNRDQHPDFAGWLRGRVAWASMVDPTKKAALERALGKALATRG